MLAAFFFFSPSLCMLTCSLPHPLPSFPRVHPPVPPFLRLLTLLRSAPLALFASSFNVPTHPSAHPQAYITTSEAPSTPSSLFIPAVIYSLFSLSLYHFIIQLNPPLSTFTSFHSSSITPPPHIYTRTPPQHPPVLFPPRPLPLLTSPLPSVLSLC